MPNSRLTTAAAAVAATLGLAGCSPSSDAAPTLATDKPTLAAPTMAAASNNQGILISPQTERQPSSGPADWFTGSVQITRPTTPMTNPPEEQGRSRSNRERALPGTLILPDSGWSSPQDGGGCRNGVVSDGRSAQETSYGSLPG